LKRFIFLDPPKHAFYDAVFLLTLGRGRKRVPKCPFRQNQVKLCGARSEQLKSDAPRIQPITKAEKMTTLMAPFFVELQNQ